MKTLVPIMLSAFLAASPLSAEEDLLSLSVGDRMPKIEAPNHKEISSFLNGGKFSIKNYDLNRDGTVDAKSAQLICNGHELENPFVLLVRYPDISRARLYFDYPTDGTIKLATSVPYPLMREFSELNLDCPLEFNNRT